MRRGKGIDGEDIPLAKLAAIALIGETGIQKPVAQHDLPRRQCRQDRLVQVLYAGRRIEERLCLVADGPVFRVEQHRADLL